MNTTRAHPWHVSPREAIVIQERLRGEVRQQTPASLRLKMKVGAYCNTPLLIGGADISYNKGSDILYAAVVVLRQRDLSLVEKGGCSGRVSFPYVPGLLSFREIPILLKAFKRLKQVPDILLCDGQGIAHPRRFGLASHIGVLLGLPTIGCAKSRLIGTYREPGLRRGATTTLSDRNEVIGKVVRTRTGVRPLYVSVGHRVDLKMAVSLVLRVSPRYRIPEPTRQAHQEVNRLRVVRGCL